MKQITVLLILSLTILAACTTTPVTTSTENNVEETDDFRVAVTFYPFFDLTKSIVGDAGEVFSVVPATTEPHSFSPSARDIANLQDIDVYVKTGVEFESFEETILDGVSSSVLIIDASQGITLLSGEEHDHNEEHEEEMDHEEEAEEHEEEHLDEHDHSGADPHVWLNPKNAIIIVNNIETSLSNNFPEYQATFSTNAANLRAELQALDEEYANSLATCNKDAILVTHNGYAYLAAEYDFEVHSISGLSPESEPTPTQLAKLVKEAKELDLQYIFFEELVNPSVAEVIADEVGAQTLTVNPVAGSNAELGYIEIMRKNLEQLKIGLECQ